MHVLLDAPLAFTTSLQVSVSHTSRSFPTSSAKTGHDLLSKACSALLEMITHLLSCSEKVGNDVCQIVTHHLVKLGTLPEGNSSQSCSSHSRHSHLAGHFTFRTPCCAFARGLGRRASRTLELRPQHHQRESSPRLQLPPWSRSAVRGRLATWSRPPLLLGSSVPRLAALKKIPGQQPSTSSRRRNCWRSSSTRKALLTTVSKDVALHHNWGSEPRTAVRLIVHTIRRSGPETRGLTTNDASFIKGPRRKQLSTIDRPKFCFLREIRRNGAPAWPAL